MQFHEVANIFPMMTTEELGKLTQDIKANGLIDAIWTYQGKIIDGRNRYQSCLAAQVPPRYQEWKGGTHSELVTFVVSLNLNRRHLTTGQRAVVALEVEKELAQAAKERMESGVNQYTPVEIIPQGTKGKARAQAAAMTGTNPRYVQDAKQIAAAAPDLIPQIASGEMTIPQAKRETKRRQQQDRIADLPQPDEKYRVVYADPPWQYNDSGVINDSDNYGRAERHYPTLSIESLCSMGQVVKEMTEKDAVLFLWVTSPLLQDAFKVIEAWGFKYKTSFVWDKIGHNFGHYNSVRHEFLLICTRGSCTPDNLKLFDSVQSIQKTKQHSAKPPEFREIIETLYTHGRKVELFARQSTPGWDVWGNEV